MIDKLLQILAIGMAVILLGVAILMMALRIQMPSDNGCGEESWSIVKQFNCSEVR